MPDRPANAISLAEAAWRRYGVTALRRPALPRLSRSRLAGSRRAKRRSTPPHWVRRRLDRRRRRYGNDDGGKDDEDDAEDEDHRGGDGSRRRVPRTLMKATGRFFGF